jgi:hypothetical protein
MSAPELPPRDLSLIRFALNGLMERAYWLAEAAAQDISGRHFKSGAAEAFLKDAKDAEALLGRLKSAAAAEPTNARALVAKQALDDGLWFVAQTAAEAYLQQELRKLHAAVEAQINKPGDCNG